MTEVLDDGPFFHGTAAVLRPGDLLTAGFRSNYRPEVVMNHVYFTALPDGAGLAAELAAELLGGDRAPHVYEVEPSGAFEDDPNVTDKKFPGNPTRSFRSTEPVRVVREVADWTRLTPEALAFWRERIIARAPADRGEILNRPTDRPTGRTDGRRGANPHRTSRPRGVSGPTCPRRSCAPRP